MKRRLSNFVTALCLLAFFVSSAACLTVVPSQQMSPTMHVHTVDASGHGCCPGRDPAGRQMSSACCTIHHQPATSVSITELQQPATTLVAVFPLPASTSLATRDLATLVPVLPQPPPLIALRI